MLDVPGGTEPFTKRHKESGSVETRTKERNDVELSGKRLVYKVGASITK
jgi:hypothetical protein